MFKRPKAIREVLLPISIVPETMHAREILTLLKQQRRSVAVVVDEFGGTAGMLTIEDVMEEIFGEIDGVENATLQFYSYRSLLISRLMAQTPMPLYFSRLFWRSLVESLVIVGAHFVDDGKSPRYIKAKNNNDMADLEIDFPWPKVTGVSKIITSLLKLKCVPMGIVKTKMGGSIHYAGTMPISKPLEYPIGMDENGLIHGTQNVYCFDSSGWKYLPSRGLTFTIMANAYRLAQNLK